MQAFNFEEKFKILEYSEYSVLIPADNEYSFCTFYFCGFGENASKYIYLLKQFFEFMTIKLPIKIIIPYPTLYKTYGNYLPDALKKVNIYSWYDFKYENDMYSIATDENRDSIVIDLVSKEIKFLETSEKIMFVGFSQGGSYLLRILAKMKIKTLFNVIFKSRFPLFKNPHVNDNSKEGQVFNTNVFYLYFSRNEKVINFQYAIESIQILKKNFTDIHIKLDNSNKHVIDYNCLSYLDKIIIKYLYKYRITKF
jgi:predicted esterase